MKDKKNLAVSFAAIIVTAAAAVTVGAAAATGVVLLKLSKLRDLFLSDESEGLPIEESHNVEVERGE